MSTEAKGMTRDQLSAHIRDIVAPLIKDTMGAQMAEMIREAVAASLGKAKPAGTNYAAQMFGAGNEDATPVKRAPGMAMARALRAFVAAKISGSGPMGALAVLKGWGDHDLAAMWQEGRQKALSAGDPTAGGFLVPIQFSTDVIELLRASAVVRSLDPTVIPISSGTLKVPRITAGATASYVGENVAVNASEQETGQLTLSFKKLISLVPISNDLVRYSSPQADAVVRDDMVRSLATREDKAFIRDDGTSSTPKGIKNWINAANKITANGTVSLANTTIDLGKMIQALLDADVPLIMAQNPAGTPNAGAVVTARGGWIMSPRTYRYLTTVQNGNGFYAFRPEMMSGNLWGFPYRVTSQVLQTMTAAGAETGGTQTELYFGAFAHAVIGEALGLQVDASTEAAYHNAAGTVTAAYSQDQTVIRVLAEHDFALRHDKAFALLQNVTWGV